MVAINNKMNETAIISCIPLWKILRISTSTSYLIRILAQTVMAAVYGVIMNLALASGINTHSNITMHMMNELSEAKNPNYFAIIKANNLI